MKQKYSSLAKDLEHFNHRVDSYSYLDEQIRLLESQKLSVIHFNMYREEVIQRFGTREQLDKIRGRLDALSGEQRAQFTELKANQTRLRDRVTELEQAAKEAKEYNAMLHKKQDKFGADALKLQNEFQEMENKQALFQSLLQKNQKRINEVNQNMCSMATYNTFYAEFKRFSG